MLTQPFPIPPQLSNTVDGVLLTDIDPESRHPGSKLSSDIHCVALSKAVTSLVPSFPEARKGTNTSYAGAVGQILNDDACKMLSTMPGA